MAKTAYKHTITITIISDTDYNFTTLDGAQYVMEEEAVGDWTQKTDEITTDEAKAMIIAMGGDPTFVFGEEED